MDFKEILRTYQIVQKESLRSVPILEKVPLDDLVQVYDYDLLTDQLTDFQVGLRQRLLEKSIGIVFIQ